MTSFSIGRIGVAPQDGGDGYDLAEYQPFRWDQQGRQVTLRGKIKAGSTDDAMFLVQQFNGLDPANNPDEDAIPVFSSTATDLNGWYNVVSAGASVTEGAFGSGGTLIVEWQAVLVRAITFARPLIEVPTVYSGLPNGLSVTSCDLLEAWPGKIGHYALGQYATTATRAGARGTINVATLATYTPLSWPGAASNTLRYFVDVDEFYVGSAYVEDTTTELTYVGRVDMASAFPVRIGNGLVRAIMGAATAQLTFQWWNGASWTNGVAVDFSVGYFFGSYNTTLSILSTAIIKNAADECIVRYIANDPTRTAANGDYYATIDVSCRRGDRCVRIFVNSGAGIGSQMKLASNTACTSKSYGLRITGTISSEYVVLTTDYATTKDTTNGRLSGGSGIPPVTYGIGVSSGGGTGTGLDDADGIGQQLMAVYGTTQKVVVG